MTQRSLRSSLIHFEVGELYKIASVSYRDIIYSIWSVSFLVLFLGISSASPLIKRAIITSVDFLGNITSTNTKDTWDLGSSDCVGSDCLNTYGDTLIYKDGSAEDRIHQTPSCKLLEANSAAYAIDNPTSVTDFNLDNGNAQIFRGRGQSTNNYSMGITSAPAMPDSTTQGILSFLKNYQPGGVNHIVSASIAIISVSGLYPTCTRTLEYEYLEIIIPRKRLYELFIE